MTLFSESFKRTRYDHWLISGLSERFVDLRKVIVDLNIPAFIIFYTYLVQKSISHPVAFFAATTYERSGTRFTSTLSSCNFLTLKCP